MKLKLKEIRKLHSNNDVYVMNGLSILVNDVNFLGESGHLNMENKGKLLHWWKENKDMEIELPEDPLPIISKVNNMVKHPDFSKRLKNRFYELKKRFITLKIKQGEIDEVYKEDDYYNFIMSGYSFHQPQSNVQNLISKIKLTGEREYDRTKSKTQVEIDLECYKTCMLCLTYITQGDAKRKFQKTTE